MGGDVRDVEVIVSLCIFMSECNGFPAVRSIPLNIFANQDAMQ